MHMIGYEHLGMNLTLILITGLEQVIQISVVILFCVKTGLSVVTPLYDVLRNAGQVKAGFSCHDSPPCEVVIEE